MFPGAGFLCLKRPCILEQPRQVTAVHFVDNAHRKHSALVVEGNDCLRCELNINQ